MMQESYYNLILWVLHGRTPSKPTRPADDYDDIAGFEPTEGY
jgi:hypothetical protein